MTVINGYRELGRRDYLLSRLAVFGVFGHQKIMLKRRPVRRRFIVGRNQSAFVDIRLLTDTRQILRGAVDVIVRYLGYSGQLKAPPKHYELFADPMHNAMPQRLWLLPPEEGAVYADVTFSRALNGPAVGLDARLQLQPAAGGVSLTDFDAVLASRDLSAMELLLPVLEQEGDSARAEKLLARMHFLSHAPCLVRKIAGLNDAKAILEYGPPSGMPDILLKKHQPEKCFEYSAVQEGFDLEALPLAKALRQEALGLSQVIAEGGFGAIEVAEGAEWLARLLVCAMLKKACPELVVSVDLADFSAQSHGLGPWLRFDVGRSFLERKGGYALRSFLG